MLVRLLYASRSTDPDNVEVLESILAQARRSNPAHGISGLLCVGGPYFVQLLEGGRDAVNALYGHIVRDERHRDVSLLHFEEILERRYAGWTMAQVNLAKVNASTILKFSERALIDPYAMSGRTLMVLLEELVATAQIVGRAG